MMNQRLVNLFVCAALAAVAVAACGDDGMDPMGEPDAEVAQTTRTGFIGIGEVSFAGFPELYLIDIATLSCYFETEEGEKLQNEDDADQILW